MREGRHRTTAAICLEPRGSGPREQKLHQSRLREDARDQLAILEVVARQGRLVLGEHAQNLVQPAVGVIDGLAFLQQLTRDILETERLEMPEGRLERLDAIYHPAPGDPGKEVLGLARMRAPLHHAGVTPQSQWQAFGL